MRVVRRTGTPCMSKFTLETGSIAIGDPVMGLARYSVSLPPGRYELEAGALVQVNGIDVEKDNAPSINLDGPYIYVLDAAKVQQFEIAFHEIGNECSYMMLEMQNRHHELEKRTGTLIGFYWEEELAGASREGKYVLDINRVRNVQ
jgi:hypothetical protein